MLLILSNILLFLTVYRFRRLMIKITGSRLFDNFVLFLIVSSCGFMVFDNPSYANQVTTINYSVSPFWD